MVHIHIIINTKRKRGIIREMVVGKGQKTGKEYTAVDKAVAFKKVIVDVCKEQIRVDEIEAKSKELRNSYIDYWIAEYLDPDEDRKTQEKEWKELFKIRIKEALKEDHTIRNAFERELMLVAEAEGE